MRMRPSRRTGMWTNMNLGTQIFGVSICDQIIMWADILILLAIIVEGDFFQRKKKAIEKTWKKFLRDSKRYFKHHHEEEV
jgi:hypothetical protein